MKKDLQILETKSFLKDITYTQKETIFEILIIFKLKIYEKENLDSV